MTTTPDQNPAPTSVDSGNPKFDVAVIGAGSGGERVATLLAKDTNQQPGMRVVVFESGLVGGECPYYACIPSKSLLADANQEAADWGNAVLRRDGITKHRNDAGHAQDLETAGVTLVRSRAVVVGNGRVEAESKIYEVDHIIIATGSAHQVLPVDGGSGLWNSADAMASDELPASLIIIGGGAIGCELSEVYANFGSTVRIVESGETLVGRVEPEVAAMMLEHLSNIGITVHLNGKVERVTGVKGEYDVVLEGGEVLASTHVLVATGKKPRLDGLGLESVGINSESVEIDERGALVGAQNIWAVGDVTQIAPYTHGANSQASVVAENIRGGHEAIRGPVIPRCVYTHPPLASVGGTTKDFADADVVVARVTFDEIARPTTDSLGAGLLTVIADRKTGSILGACGYGHAMDEVIGQLTMAIETQWSVQRLQRLVQPFPTVSELVGVAYRALAESMSEVSQPHG
jgi:pyruvate/2-oxoglutarate dehydrogenase complex dihydrolipoamide dehydrogenase (E3) component